MTTEKLLIDQIKSLSELEFVALFEDLSDHIRRQGWEGIIEEEFQYKTKEDFDRDYDYLERRNETLNDQVYDLSVQLRDIKASMK